MRGRVKAEWAGEAILEHSPIGSSQSNGAVERAIRSVEGQVRDVKDAVEQRTGCVLAAGRPVMPWLTQHCAGILTRYIVGDDKKTAYERLKGKPFNEKLAPFREYGHFMVAAKNSEAAGKLDPR